MKPLLMEEQTQIQASIHYVTSLEKQRKLERKISKTLSKLNNDNAIFSFVSRELESGYGNLIKQVIGIENYDWIEWWIYEGDFGKNPEITFSVNEKQYFICNLSLEEFLKIIWTSTTNPNK